MKEGVWFIMLPLIPDQQVVEPRDMKLGKGGLLWVSAVRKLLLTPQAHLFPCLLGCACVCALGWGLVAVLRSYFLRVNLLYFCSTGTVKSRIAILHSLANIEQVYTCV